MVSNEKKQGRHLKREAGPIRKWFSGLSRGQRGAVIAAAVLAALVLLAVIGWNLLFVRPHVGPGALPTLPGGDISEEDLTQPVLRTDGDRREGVYTFLAFGRDTGGGGNTDTMMVVSYDTAAQKLNAVNLPRDTMVNVSWDLKTRIITI